MITIRLLVLYVVALVCYCDVLVDSRTVGQLEQQLHEQSKAYEVKLHTLSEELNSLKSQLQLLMSDEAEADEEDIYIPVAQDECPKNCEGKKGRKGKKGPAGPPGPAGGTVYTRWGKSTCPEESELLYAGYAANSNYNQDGGGVNYLCLVPDPSDNPIAATEFHGSLLAGVEYETYAAGIFPDDAFNQNAPCARCYTENRPAQMMIPGKTTCPKGWTTEYEGYLMSAYYKENHQYTYECVDSDPDYIPSLSTSTNGGQFYFVRPDCGKLHKCPPYNKDEEITCVVCTK